MAIAMAIIASYVCILTINIIVAVIYIYVCIYIIII